ncbi:hypothetical protein BaRGS_00005854 [Batillaria attramentaria]|uniref:Uncharacterized protein n=1 Tax=Batillaria attramentaria TaxID=370345 RepID=A0ABD0LUJ6_9CAEN
MFLLISPEQTSPGGPSYNRHRQTNKERSILDIDVSREPLARVEFMLGAFAFLSDPAALRAPRARRRKERSEHAHNQGLVSRGPFEKRGPSVWA